ncbi:hypothetical protein GCM10011529_04140 [Polymorphobacter glacialis]|uniref:UrcA family protein n=1 Tax=Sandarakinorhabdus glacialis TaxID=1614636 RepID=A0A916ZJJ4_9SPHN|nr:UrcA family protein [Polymorphobacter glacialis]GGE01035.1 hypothetical protein GCM10011529_04140 [Polymorphobacter glacialis]
MFKFLVVALLAAAPVMAQAEIVTRNVRVADLDLRSPAGLAELDRRIDRAARQVCETGGVKPIWEHRIAETCRTGAVAGAMGEREAVLAAAQTTRLAAR